jgi:glycosyltransferase involved in cell wall biosynthesis
MGLAGLINAKRLLIPCIGSVHTLLPEFWKPFLDKHLPHIVPPFLNKVLKGILKRVDRFSLFGTTIDLSSFFMEELSWRYFAQFFKRCDISLVPSKYAQQLCQKHGFKTTVLPNGVDFAKFLISKNHDSFNTRWQLDPKDRVVIYVGRLSEEKNIDLILKAASKIVRTTDYLKFMIVGDGPHRAKLEKLVEKYNISGEVIFTGYLKQEALSEVYSRASLFINASPLETQGLSVIEAMYFGCPVLSINSGAVAELFENTAIGFLFENSDELVERISHLIDNETDIKQFSTQLIEIYESFLSRKK